MSSRLANISAKPTLVQFAQGAAQSAIQPVADFLAPTVQVATSVGQFKKYDEKSRFRIPDTRRAVGGNATQLRFDATDATYNCKPHALDYPVDNLEQLEAQGMENMLMEGATAIAEVAALAHEKDVISKALTAVGAGTDINFESATVDPVNEIDTRIVDVLKAAKYGSLMSVGVLFGVTAWRRFKNNALVRSRFIAGSGLKNGVASLTDEQAQTLLLGNPQTRVSFMVEDTAPEGKAESMSFLLDTAVLVFARHAQPTRRDPSFMKTFRLMGEWMKPGSYVKEDGRGEVAKFDWSEDVQVTNSAACVRINATNS
jgi:hypothetical protein